MQEDKVAISSLFITLTYDTKRVPITPNGFMGLCKRDGQLFFKRLRINLDRSGYKAKLKYYFVGEYGGKSMRPHYHVILFNVPIECIKLIGVRDSGKVYMSRIIEDSWDLGSIDIGGVSAASVGYTLKYISKKSKVPMHRNDDRLREFSLMSKGLGINYLTHGMSAWHCEDLINRLFCTTSDGVKLSMPRYYKDKIYSEGDREIIAAAFKLKMEQKLIDEQGDHVGDYWHNRAEAIYASFRSMEIDSKNVI